MYLQPLKQQHCRKEGVPGLPNKLTERRGAANLLRSASITALSVISIFMMYVHVSYIYICTLVIYAQVNSLFEEKFRLSLFVGHASCV